MSAADGPSCVLHRGGTENPLVFAMSTTYMAAALAYSWRYVPLCSGS